MENLNLKIKNLMDFINNELLGKVQLFNSEYVKIIHEAIEDINSTNNFKIAVIGEFKRGKSSVVNALTGKNLIPATILPCTSNIVEVKYGDIEQYYKLGEDGKKQEKSKEYFREHITRLSNLNKSLKENTQANEELNKINIWEIYISSSFFDNNKYYTLVDIPGGEGEDLIRNQLIKKEFKAAHALIMVMDACQLGSLTEIEMVKQLGKRVQGLVIVINKIDLVPEEELPSLVDHILSRLKEYNIDKKQIVLFNAKKVIEEQTEGNKNGEVPELLENLMASLDNFIFKNTNNIKIANIKEIIKRMKDELLHPIEEQNKCLSMSKDELDKEYNERIKEKNNAEESVKKVYEKLNLTAQSISYKFEELFIKDWPGVINKIKDNKSSWLCKQNPIIYTKVFAQEIAKQAEHDLLKEIDSWSNSILPLLEDEFNKGIEECQSYFSIISVYLEKTKGASREIYEKDLLKKSFLKAFGNAPEVDKSLVAKNTVLAGFLSFLSGYIVADIILYYILGIISGFLNPILLAAAVALGSGGFLIKGQTFVSDKIRDDIVDKITSVLLEDNLSKQIRVEIKNNITEKIRSFAEVFNNNASVLIEETEKPCKDSLNKVQNSKDEQEKFNIKANEIRKLLTELEQKL